MRKVFILQPHCNQACLFQTHVRQAHVLVTCKLTHKDNHPGEVLFWSATIVDSSHTCKVFGEATITSQAHLFQTTSDRHTSWTGGWQISTLTAAINTGIHFWSAANVTPSHTCRNFCEVPRHVCVYRWQTLKQPPDMEVSCK